MNRRRGLCVSLLAALAAAVALVAAPAQAASAAGELTLDRGASVLGGQELSASASAPTQAGLSLATSCAHASASGDARAAGRQCTKLALVLAGPEAGAAKLAVTIANRVPSALRHVAANRTAITARLADETGSLNLGARSAAAKSGDDVADVAANAARVARQPSTPWGRTIQSFRDNPDDWRRVSAHAEEAIGKSYRGGVSSEEVFERGSDRLVRHRIYGPQGDILHQTFRPYAKFGAP